MRLLIPIIPAGHPYTWKFGASDEFFPPLEVLLFQTLGSESQDFFHLGVDKSAYFANAHSLTAVVLLWLGHVYVTPYTLILANYLIMIVILFTCKVYPDRACKRTVLSLTVKCHNSGNECDWTGELHNLPVSICFRF